MSTKEERMAEIHPEQHTPEKIKHRDITPPCVVFFLFNRTQRERTPEAKRRDVRIPLAVSASRGAT